MVGHEGKVITCFVSMRMELLFDKLSKTRVALAACKVKVVQCTRCFEIDVAVIYNNILSVDNVRIGVENAQRVRFLWLGCQIHYCVLHYLSNVTLCWSVALSVAHWLG